MDKLEELRATTPEEQAAASSGMYVELIFQDGSKTRLPVYTQDDMIQIGGQGHTGIHIIDADDVLTDMDQEVIWYSINEGGDTEGILHDDDDEEEKADHQEIYGRPWPGRIWWKLYGGSKETLPAIYGESKGGLNLRAQAIVERLIAP